MAKQTKCPSRSPKTASLCMRCKNHAKTRPTLSVWETGYARCAGAGHEDYTRTRPLPPEFTFTARRAWEGRTGKSNRGMKQYCMPFWGTGISPSPPRPKYAMQQVRKTIKRNGVKPIALEGKWNVRAPLLEKITFPMTRSFRNVSYKQLAQQ